MAKGIDVSKYNGMIPTSILRFVKLIGTRTNGGGISAYYRRRLSKIIEGDNET